MPIFKKRTEAFSAPVGTPALAAPSRGEVQNGLFAVPPPTLAGDLYRALREAVPVIDAAIYKLMRLTGGFRAVCENERFQPLLDDFSAQVPVDCNPLPTAFLSSF